MTGLLRLLAVLSVVAWYFVVRTAVFYEFDRHDTVMPDFVWVWSFLMALPLTALSVFAAAGAFEAFCWVARGFNQEPQGERTRRQGSARRR